MNPSSKKKAKNSSTKNKKTNDAENNNVTKEDEEELLLSVEDDNLIDKELLQADNLQIKKVDYKKEKIKDSDALKVAESVLDVETRTTLFKLRKKGIIDYFTGIISTGKEANVYHAFAPDGTEYAVKIYRTSTNIFKGLQIYIVGDTRFSKIKRDQRSFVYAWAKKEFKNLSRAYKANVAVPKPVIAVKDVVIMEFLGENGLPHNLMKDMIIEEPHETYKEVLRNIRKLYRKAGLVHADLSEYNMIYTPKVYFIDISQAVLLDHQYAELFLYRDLKNITRYFSAQGAKVQDLDKLYESLVGEPPSNNILAYEL